MKILPLNVFMPFKLSQKCIKWNNSMYYNEISIFRIQFYKLNDEN